MERLNQVRFWILCVLAMAFPLFHTGILSLLVALLFLVSLFSVRPGRRVEWGTMLMAGILFFSLNALSLLWCDNTGLGLRVIETKLSFLLFPLALGISGFVSRKNVGQIFSCLIGSSVFSVFLSLVLSFLDYMDTGELESLSYSGLTHFVHGTYLSMYYVVSVSVLLFHSIKNYKSKRELILIYSSLGILVVMITMMAVKMAIITLIMVLIFSAVQYYREKQTKNFLVFGGVFLLMVLVFLNPMVTERISQAVQETSEFISEDDIQIKEPESTSSRLVVWRSSLGIINEDILAGKGVGDYQDELLKKYEEGGHDYIVEKGLNAHNQYLETALGTGLVGLSILLITLAFFIYMACLRRDVLMLVIGLVIALNLVTESMLERQAGAVFIAFIFSLFLFRENESRN